MLSDKDIKSVTVNVFYMFKKISTDTENIFKNPNWTYKDKNYNVWDKKNAWVKLLVEQTFKNSLVNLKIEQEKLK